MPVSAAFLEYVLEQLSRTGRLTSRRMFGAVGIYSDGVFFAVIDDDTLYFKVGDETRPDYETRGMQPFRPYADKPEVSMSYYTVPADILDDAEDLVAWARRSVAVAASSVKPGRRRAAAAMEPGKAPRKPANAATRPAKTAKVARKSAGPASKPPKQKSK